MGKVLVTGANGHLGNNIVRLLLAEGREVRVMVRRNSNLRALDGLDVERTYGDLLDGPAIMHAVRGCETVYHAAATFLFWAKGGEAEIIRPTVEGSNSVLEAASSCGVQKLVYVSTSGTIGLGTTSSECRDESYVAEHCVTAYLRAKLTAERAALEFQRRANLPVVFVLPGLILGPRFYQISSSLKLVADFLNAPSPAYFDGGFSVVDVEDVARGALLAEKKGRTGERYLLTGDNVPVETVFRTLADLTGLPPPRFRAPRLVMRSLATVMGGFARIFGGIPAITTEQVDEFLGNYAYFSCEKATREFGYTYLPYREVLRRTIEWMLANGFVKESRRRVISLAPA